MIQIAQDIKNIEPTFDNINTLTQCFDLWEEAWNYNVPKINYQVHNNPITITHNFFGVTQTQTPQEFINDFGDWVEEYPFNRANGMSELQEEIEWITSLFIDVIKDIKGD